jgi:DNA (cytosine-5)-methyltransferase 1
MRAFYNEIEPYCCAWLSNLMDAGHITPGVICDKSIEDVRPDELIGFDRVHMFAGIGVWDYALNLAGWGAREVWTGSAPCQPFSAAGKGVGFDDERHLWPAWFHLIDQCRPDTVFGEQVASPDALHWLDLVRTDMEAADYAFGALDLCAAGAGAPHLRQRLFFMADANGDSTYGGNSPVQMGRVRLASEATQGHYRSGTQWANEPRPSPLAYGITYRMESVRSYGNAIVAELAAEFIRAARETINA